MPEIYFFIQHYPNWKTGGHKYHSRLYEWALRNGYNAKVFGNSKIEDRYFKNKIIRVFYGLLNTFRIPRKSLIVMTNASFLDYILPIKLNKLLKRQKYFFIIHHLVQKEKPGSRSRRFLESKFIKCADYIITVSETTRKQLHDLGLANENIAIIPPGLDKADISNKVFPDKFTMLYVGTIEKRKGLIDVIRALNDLIGYDYKLNVVGLIKEEEYFDEISQLINDQNLNERVIFLGRLSDDELIEQYRHASIFIFPSYWEGYGMVVAEALAWGLPVIASKISAFEELITDGREGYFFKAGDPDDISSKLKFILDNREILKELSANALKRADVMLSYDQMSLEIMKEVDKFIEANNDYFEPR